MKKTLCFLMLAISITGQTFAQPATKNSDKIFDLPPDYARHRMTIDLGKGNKMQIELADFNDLHLFTNIDSVIRVFLQDIEPFKDSLADELTSRRIDYTTDSSGIKKIRIQKFASKGSNFVVRNGDVAALKLEQDTINILGTISFIAKYSMRKPFASVRRYRLRFFLNDISDMQNYIGAGLNRKIQAIQDNSASTWINNRGSGGFHLRAEPSVSAKLPRGLTGGGDFLNFRISVDIQNYKNYFVPSFSVGAGLIMSTSHFKRDIVLSWDPHYFFSKNNEGRLKTFRNDFLTLTWGQGFVRDNEPRKESHLLFIMSLAYLVKRDGEYFDKNTFRVGGGRLSLFGGKTKIEPAMYFNNFFKGVTPGLRFIQSF